MIKMLQFEQRRKRNKKKRQGERNSAREGGRIIFEGKRFKEGGGDLEIWRLRSMEWRFIDESDDIWGGRYL